MTTGAGEVVVGGEAVAVEVRTVVASTAGQGTNTKTRGKQETAPKQQEKLNNASSSCILSRSKQGSPPRHVFWTQTKTTDRPKVPTLTIN